MPDSEVKVTPVYNKVPLWQWVIVYILVGIIIYGIFYSFITLKNRGNNLNLPVGEEAVPEKVSEVEQNLDKDSAEIELTDEGFSPDTVTIKPGTKVVWKNTSGVTGTINSDDHPTHELYAFLNLGQFEDGKTLSVVISEVGTYTYHNHLNPEQTGTIVVEDEEGN